MIALLFKEINSFFSSLIGYIAIGVFLITLGLLLWVFPVSFNVLGSGYASIDGLFLLAPWVFMFLVPAITMRLFSEEFKNGTIELLLTKPISDWHIILAKFLAGLLIVVLALLPTLTYYISVHFLGNPVGNIDTGGMWGSYIGLFLLAAAFVAIGVFASSVNNNQVVAFITAVFISFICFMGIDSISTLPVFKSIESVLLSFSINEHYIALSRGVIDSRDVLFMVSTVAFFLLLTKVRLESRKW